VLITQRVRGAVGDTNAFQPHARGTFRQTTERKGEMIAVTSSIEVRARSRPAACCGRGELGEMQLVRCVRQYFGHRRPETRSLGSFGERFPPQDAVGGWILLLAATVNDLKTIHSRMKEDAQERELLVYWHRLAFAHYREAGKLLSLTGLPVNAKHAVEHFLLLASSRASRRVQQSNPGV
jgi:hypothetical protein